MERELLFADKLQELKDTAKAQGNLVTKAQVEESFEEFGLQKDQLDLVYDYLKKHRIGIGTPVDTEEYLTGEEKNYLQLYINELKELPACSAGEKEAIILSAMAGDGDAQERLLTLYLPQVVDIAKLYAGQGVYLEDLIGEGNVAAAMGVRLLGALEHASEAEGALAKMVMDAMEEYIAANAEEGKKSRQVLDKVNKVALEAKKLADEYGRKVTAEELAQESTLSLKAIQEAMRISGDKIEDLEKS
ncbi:MAG: hypothetical protein J1E83_03160 [Lachnospiraceae bacterium]|nr:hypothetical protein [Lachnospiraceae bacterium]